MARSIDALACKNEYVDRIADMNDKIRACHTVKKIETIIARGSLMPLSLIIAINNASNIMKLTSADKTARIAREIKISDIEICL